MRDLKKEKIYIVIVAILVIIIALGVVIFKSIKLSSNEETKVEYDVSEFTKIDVKKMIELFKDEKKQVFFISNGSSKYDAEFSQSLKKIRSKIDQDIYVIDVHDISSSDEYYEEYKSMISKATEFYLKNVDPNIDSLLGTTPLLIISKNGEVKNVLLGNTDYSDLKEWIINNIYNY